MAAWMVHALHGVHQVATLTSRPWSAAGTNAFYGTAIRDGGITAYVVPAPWRWLSMLPEHRLSRIQMCSVLRFARELACDHDLLLTADNYGPFVKPGMQYLHLPLAVKPTPWRLRAVVNLYFVACNRLIGVPWAAAARNVTLANSRWTAENLARQHDVRARHVLYPPVVDPGEGLPWEQRRNTFLCIGRFHGSKRIEVSMSILRRLRAEVMPDAGLIIVGSPVDPEYSARIRRFAARDRHWIEFREDLPRPAIDRLMGECRYGLQAMEDEHFGMATAELARAGCLVFPHHSGGSPEVVNDEPALLWRTEDEAVARVSAMARDAALRDAVRWRLRTHARSFSAERFVTEMRAIVDEWSAESSYGSGGGRGAGRGHRRPGTGIEKCGKDRLRSRGFPRRLAVLLGPDGPTLSCPWHLW